MFSEYCDGSNSIPGFRNFLPVRMMERWEMKPGVKKCLSLSIDTLCFVHLPQVIRTASFPLQMVE
jgi:hypothetical protein